MTEKYGRADAAGDKAVWTVDVAGDMGESSVDAWHSSIGWKGATWLSRGLPRGTPRLVRWLLYKIWLWHGRGFETVTSRQANGLAERAIHPGDRWNLLIK
jgi:hypothetical protein